MMKKVLFAGIFLLVCGLFAFDRDFSVRGSGADAPGLLQVFRRGKGYVFVLEAARPSVVTVQKGGKELFQFSTEKPEFRLFREKKLTVWSLPDSVSKVRDTDFLEVTARFAEGRRLLPDASGGALLVSGRKGKEYSWNDENGTILEQVSNRALVFSDASFDVSKSCCGDLVSGAACVEGKELILTAVLRQDVRCNMRVLLDTLPESGYSGDGVDFMLDNHNLSRFDGSSRNQWKWQTLGRVSFEKTGKTLRWRVPLEKIRPHGHGRMRFRFQSHCPKGNCGDVMPTYGKILPVLRPGNLAAEKETQISVSSCHPQYKSYPLVDGQTSRRIHWCYESFAAGQSVFPRFAAFTFPVARPVRMVTVWWEAFPKKPALQIMDSNGRWVDVPLAVTAAGTENALHQDNETGAIIRKNSVKLEKNQQKSFFPLPAGTVTCGIRVLEMARNGSLWVREIEIY